ncbi:MAG TPA: hypothetical protein VFY40_25600 [Blastocatellia bacterium]|nr:hypothetical protein [Blastocatellia bacterium]
MKQESEEKTIKELFQRLKQEDERRAPSFADSWAAALSRRETRAPNWLRWSMAAAAAILIVFGFIVYRAIQNEPLKPNGAITEKESPKATGAVTEKAAPPKPSVERKEQVVKKKRAPRPLRHNRPPLNEPIISYSMPVYGKRGEYATDFIPLNYGGVQKPMESGEVVRLEMPRSALIAFGLPVNVEQADTPVKAELLLGEDGMARAIRFLR